MLSIQHREEPRGKCVLNVLPCRINHSGPVHASKRYWGATAVEGKKRTSYFRGRKLHGKSIRVPDAYKGVVLSTTTAKIPIEPQVSQDSDDEENEPTLEVGIMKERAEFEELVVWGHESLPDDSADTYVRGMEEWIVFSELIHSCPSDATGTKACENS